MVEAPADLPEEGLRFQGGTIREVLPGTGIRSGIDSGLYGLQSRNSLEGETLSAAREMDV